MRDYWNHNAAYHRAIVRAARRHRGEVLDVGCGDGLLVQRLSAVSASVTGIEPHPATHARAAQRLVHLPNTRLAQVGFAEFEAGTRRFDLIVFVASLHHLDLTESLRKAAELLRPDGDLLVVGLAANKSGLDWVISGLLLPAIRVSSALHRETRDIGVPVAEARESLAEIRRTARQELPGVRIRRGLYYRYLLRWTKPVGL